MPVNCLEEFRFELLRPQVEIALAIGAALCRELEQRYVRAHVLGEPVPIHAQIKMRNIRPDPTAPFEIPSAIHSAKRLKSVEKCCLPGRNHGSPAALRRIAWFGRVLVHLLILAIHERRRCH